MTDSQDTQPTHAAETAQQPHGAAPDPDVPAGRNRKR
jgi:hypothetical protein